MTGLFLTFRCQHGLDPLLVREFVEEVLAPGEVRLRQPPEDGAGVVVVHVTDDAVITLLGADEEMPAELGELAEGQPLVGIVVEAVQGPGSAMAFGESFILALLYSFVHVELRTKQYGIIELVSGSQYNCTNSCSIINLPG